MTRFLLLTMLSLTLSVSGCDGASPVDAPLPSFAELEAAFPPQPPGQGIVREGENYRSGGFTVDATYFDTGVADLRFVINIEESNGLRGVGIDVGGEFADLEDGDTFENARFIYGGIGDAARGGGRLKITEIDAGRVSGVFAADLTSDSLVPVFPRVTGRFNATLAPEE